MPTHFYFKLKDMCWVRWVFLGLMIGFVWFFIGLILLINWDNYNNFRVASIRLVSNRNLNNENKVGIRLGQK